MLLLAGAVPFARGQEGHKEKAKSVSKPGPYAVETLTADWHDKTRDRDVPVKIYYPKSGRGPFPVIIFSHGLGGSRDGYEYLGRYWAGHGYVSVHLQHPGSDAEVWKGRARPMEALRRAAKDPQAARNRPLDVRFAIDQAERIGREHGPLEGRLDRSRIGMAGHSFGAWTTLVAAGEAMIGPGSRERTLADPRIKAAVAMSAPVPQNKDILDQAFAGVKIPCFQMTGTLDDSPIGETKALERRLPFDHIRAADQYLVTFNGGDHAIFGGRSRLLHGGEKDAVFQDLILAATTAFWDAYLKGDAQAEKFLTGDGFKMVLGKEGTFEKKNLNKRAQ
jgi:predicted dienelactone hydrolase